MRQSKDGPEKLQELRKEVPEDHLVCCKLYLHLLLGLEAVRWILERGIAVVLLLWILVQVLVRLPVSISSICR